MKKIIFLLFLCLCACRTPLTIIDRPITFDDDRQRLSLEYMQQRYGISKEIPLIDPKMIVLHHTVVPTAEKTMAVFNPPLLPGTRSDIQSAGRLNVSSHFLVDRDGTIYRLLPEVTMARHVIGLNHCAIGVENVGGTEDLPLTRAQKRANIRLVRYLSSKYDIEYLIGHHEYTRFEGHPLWKEQDSSYRTKKDDPGVEFMTGVRKAVRNLDFKPLP